MKARTNEDYFQKFGRRVIGTIITEGFSTLPEYLTILRWDNQEGSVNPGHQGMNVLMLTRVLDFIPETLN